MKQIVISALAACGMAVPAFGTVELRVSPGGGISFDGGEMAVVAYRPGWTGCQSKIDWKGSSPETRAFAVEAGGGRLFDGRGQWTQQDDGTVKGVVSLACASPADMQCVALAANIPAPPPSGLGDGSAQTYDLTAAGGRTIRLTFDAPVRYHAQDSRRWGGAWSVRFGEGIARRRYAAGDRLEWTVTVSSPEGVSLRPFRPYVVAENDGWVKIDYRKDIAPGSALDLSAQGLQDAPAGRHGWLRSVGGRFEFEGKPGAEQRFYGVNLCFTANYLPHEDADMLVDRLVRCGYNTVRVHHHDGAWFASEKNRDRLDYLIAKAIGKGLYVTTDLYVSRQVKWREIGIDRDGEMDKQLYKTYIGIHEPAFSNWCVHAKAFLEHVNPYTGRAYRDEPAMPLISLVNEGRLAMHWTEKKSDERLAAAWRAFGGEGEMPNPWSGRTQEAHRRFDEWINGRVWDRCSTYVRSLGAKALLTNDNNGRYHGEGEGLTPRYDYVDNHFYVDHPTFLDQQWRLPSRCDNRNPIALERPPLFHKGYAKGASKPYTISEWNFSGPGRYRAMGGILTGALAAEQGWDGLWRFAYSHSDRNLKDNPSGGPGYFDCVTDPLIAASDRASVCLYLRRDAVDGALRTDRTSGSMTLISPRTCGGFAEGGEIAAGPLTFAAMPCGAQGDAAPTTLWVSSLDGRPIAESSRMLLTHLTDIQGKGARFADDLRTVLLSWGHGCLIASGAAKVSLRVADPAAFKVYELDTAGNRQGEVPAGVEDGALALTVSTGGPRGGRIYYEIVAR